MSKIGKMPVVLPDSVKAELKDQHLTITGPKGTLSLDINQRVKVVQQDNTLLCTIEEVADANLWGLTRSLIDNMVVGVTQGYTKQLKVIGVGFDAQTKGKELVLKVGFSHPVSYPIPEGIDVVCEKDPKWDTIVTISWIDKQLVGQTTAQVREIRPPEPYKGKGIRYTDEVVKMKEGKKAAK